MSATGPCERVVSPSGPTIASTCAAQDGANVPLTVFGRRLTEAETAGRQTTADLPPGGTFVDEILLNLMFDMSLPQKYVLHVERGVRKLNGSGFTVVVSNPAEVLIEIDN